MPVVLRWPAPFPKKELSLAVVLKKPAAPPKKELALPEVLLPPASLPKKALLLPAMLLPPAPAPKKELRKPIVLDCPATLPKKELSSPLELGVVVPIPTFPPPVSVMIELPMASAAVHFVIRPGVPAPLTVAASAIGASGTSTLPLPSFPLARLLSIRAPATVASLLAATVNSAPVTEAPTPPGLWLVIQTRSTCESRSCPRSTIKWPRRVCDLSADASLMVSR